MKKINKLLLIFFHIALALIIMWRYQETMFQMEATDFFVWTSDYLNSKWADYPYVPALLSDYLLQFFRWQGVGSLILTIVMFAISTLMLMIPRLLKITHYKPLSLFLPLVLMVVTPFQLQIYLEFMFMLVFAIAFLRIMKMKNTPVKSLIFVCLAWISVFFMSWMLLLVAAVMMIVGTAVMPRENRLHAVMSIAVAALVVVLLGAWSVRIISNACSFIPIEQRWISCPADAVNRWIYFLLLLVASLLIFIPQWKSRMLERCVTGVMALLSIFVLVNLVLDENLRREEQAFRFSSLADKKDWKTILEEVSPNEFPDNRPMLQYALLAEQGLGTLPEHMFSYPVMFSFNMTYFEISNYYCTNYNCQYYDLMEIYDECYHYALETGVNSRLGQSFYAIRNLVKYALLVHDFDLAEKYIELLSNSTTHKGWAKKWRQALIASKQKDMAKGNQKVVRSAAFTNNMNKGVEMLCQLEEGCQNNAIIDQALLGFLLDCDLEGFMTVLRRYPAYANKMLPKAYAEAVAMIIYDTQDEDLRKYVNYSEEYDELFKEFDMLYMLKMQGKEIDKSKYEKFYGSYWNYYTKMSKLNIAKKGDGGIPIS